MIKWLGGKNPSDLGFKIGDRKRALKPFLVAHSCTAFTACCRCLSMVSRERPRKQIARSSTKSALKMSLAIQEGSSLIFSPKHVGWAIFWVFLVKLVFNHRLYENGPGGRLLNATTKINMSIAGQKVTLMLTSNPTWWQMTKISSHWSCRWQSQTSTERMDVLHSTEQYKSWVDITNLWNQWMIATNSQEIPCDNKVGFLADIGRTPPLLPMLHEKEGGQTQVWGYQSTLVKAPLVVE